jgi:hypothetical protein
MEKRKIEENFTVERCKIEWAWEFDNKDELLFTFDSFEAVQWE